MNGIFKLNLPTIEKMTYMALTRYADNNNRAWPKYETLAGDVSCGRKRVIQAVSRLIACKLIVKHERKNRTNLYLVYPPEYFCEKTEDEDNRGVERTPRAETGVSTEHPEGVEKTPPGCPQVTLRVSTEHPISTNISTSDNSSSTNKTGSEKREIVKTEISEKEIDKIRRAFKSKGVQVNDSVICELLNKYALRSITGAIHCTDFTQARNPIRVIYWMLETGAYVVPVEEESTAALRPDPVLTPEDEASVRQLIKEAKQGLLKKTARPVTN